MDEWWNIFKLVLYVCVTFRLTVTWQLPRMGSGKNVSDFILFFPPSGFNWKRPSCLILHTTRGKVFTQKPASISLALNHCQAQTQQLQVVCYWFIHFDPFSNPSPDLYLYKTHLHLRTFKTMVMQHQPKVWRHLLVQLFFFIFIRDT